MGRGGNWFGMGGLSAASLLSTDGKKVLVLEAGIHPGGCGSSYARKGYVFESGATTLVDLTRPTNEILGRAYRHAHTKERAKPVHVGLVRRSKADYTHEG